MGAAGGLFLGLSLLLRLPDLVGGTAPAELAPYLSHPPRIYYLFSLDLFALLSLLAIVPYRGNRSRVRAFVAGSILFLLVYRTYDAGVLAILHRSPMFYADATHLVGALYLVLNASLSWGHVAGLVAGAGLLVGLGGGLPFVLRRLHRWLSTPRGRRAVLVANAVVWPIILFTVVAERATYLNRTTYRSACLSTTECLVRNVKASVTLWKEVARQANTAADSTYAEYFELEWEQTPSLYLVMLESYGRGLTGPESPVAYNRFMGRMADSLGAAGWHTASAQSEAPVFGGLSWLSAATLLMGTPVEHQPVFDVIRPTLSRYPHLVRLLQRQGYETATLQPPVRARPGLAVENPYGFDRTFYLEDLDYQGPRFGWGIVPDQYSLAVAHERFVAQASSPFFLFFETVTSHAPWTAPPPPRTADPMALGRGAATSGAASRQGERARVASTPWADTLSQTTRLFRHVQYDWRVLTDYLRTQAPPNSLVVVVGDHQPFFADGESKATPVHVLSRDEGFLRRVESYGFVSGLQPPDSASFHHAGLYSLLVRVLTVHDRAASAEAASVPVPPYRPHGVARSALLPHRP
jgi:hypothetical protein